MDGVIGSFEAGVLAEIGQRCVMTFNDLARQAFGDAGVNSLNQQLDE
ncbi:hypothetical protein [Roseobacter weihaiensis]|nr:hypothetical protein [Roseobacter sp. H9]